MPNGVSSTHAHFLGNKLYCLGGYQENKTWAMAYDLSLNKWDSLVYPRCYPRNTHNIFSVAIEVLTPTIVRVQLWSLVLSKSMMCILNVGDYMSL